MIRHILIVLTILLLGVPADAQWQQVNSGTDADLAGMTFLKNKIGFAVGDRVILKTVDRGENWTEIITHETFHFITDVAVSNDTVQCFGRHDNGQFFAISFHVNDKKYSKRIINYSPKRPQSVDGELWYLMDDRLMKRGSSTAMLENINDFNVNSSIVTATSADMAYFSSDLGRTWDSISLEPLLSGKQLTNFYFDGSDTLLATAQAPNTLFYSYDRGANWKSRLIEEGVSFFINRTKMLLFESARKKLMTSKDMGQTFQTNGVEKPVSGLSMTKDHKIFLYGKQGTIYKTRFVMQDTIVSNTGENSLYVFIEEDSHLAYDDGKQLDADSEENKKYSGWIRINSSSGPAVEKMEILDQSGMPLETVYTNIISYKNLKKGTYILRIKHIDGSVIERPFILGEKY